MKLKITTISIEPPLLTKAKLEAKTRRQSFSQFICSLIESDLRKEKQENRSRT